MRRIRRQLWRDYPSREPLTQTTHPAGCLQARPPVDTPRSGSGQVLSFPLLCCGCVCRSIPSHHSPGDWCCPLPCWRGATEAQRREAVGGCIASKQQSPDPSLGCCLSVLGIPPPSAALPFLVVLGAAESGIFFEFLWGVGCGWA